ncbi:extracellular solute-binding protein [Paenibacillus lemnae]|uniref:Extracellular solute-binding protein n=2 Tax=Paenibacillus lemnae TaxID=1330551 RepID=A0A848MC51_PAELE|nr:extracellular solute-binding protein [Paenibacillus lemnae]
MAIVAGCGNSGGGNGAAPAEGSDKKDSGNNKDRVTLKVEVFDRGNSPEGVTVTNNEMTKYVQENFGDPNNIDVEFVAIPRSEEINNLNVLMAAGTAPDVIFTYNQGAAYSWAKQGGLTDLASAIDEHGPQLKEYLKDSLQYGVFDGSQFAVVARRVHLQKYSSIIRQDWLDQLNMPVPTTTEETYETLKAFKDNKLGGDRTIPFAFALAPDSYEPVIWSFIKEQSDEARYLRSVTIGSREYPILMDGHKEGVQFLNKLYNEGLLDPDFALDKDKKKKTENFVNGHSGLFTFDTGTAFGGESSTVAMLEKNVPDASVVPLLPFTDFEGKSRQPAYTPAGMYIMVPSFSERSAEAIKYLNWMAQDEVIQFMAFGEEGVHFDMVDGFPVGKDGDVGAKLLYNSGDMLIVTNGIDFGSAEKNREYMARMVQEKHREMAKQSMEFSDKDAVQQPIAFDKPLDSEAKYSVVMLEKYEELLVKSIMSSEANFDKTYDAAIKDFMDTAGNEVFAERKAAYEAMK